MSGPRLSSRSRWGKYGKRRGRCKDGAGASRRKRVAAQFGRQDMKPAIDPQSRKRGDRERGCEWQRFSCLFAETVGICDGQPTDIATDRGSSGEHRFFFEYEQSKSPILRMAIPSTCDTIKNDNNLDYCRGAHPSRIEDDLLSPVRRNDTLIDSRRPGPLTGPGRATCDCTCRAPAPDSIGAMRNLRACGPSPVASYPTRPAGGRS